MNELIHELDHGIYHELDEVWFSDPDFSWLFDYVNDGLDVIETEDILGVH